MFFGGFFINQPKSIPLGLQIPSKKVLWGVFRGLSTFLEGIWSPRVPLGVLEEMVLGQKVKPNGDQVGGGRVY